MPICFARSEKTRDLFQAVRQQLIADGLAIDRNGVGLELAAELSDFEQVSSGNTAAVQTKSAGARDTKANSAVINIPNEWWIMRKGVVHGPYSTPTIQGMRNRHEFQPGDVFRNDLDKSWKSEKEYQQIFERGSPKTPSADSNRILAHDLEPQFEATELDSPDRVEALHQLPGKSWNIAKYQRHGRVKQLGIAAVHLAGGPARLTVISILIITIFALIGWWQLPPSNLTIYSEFVQMRSVLKRLQDRRVGRSEWESTTSRYRDRIRSITNRLKFWSTNRFPLSQSLYVAGTQGLLPMLDNPMSVGTSDWQFDQQMQKARSILEKSTPADKLPVAY